MLGDKFTDMFIRGIIESVLWQHNCHTSAGFEEAQISFDKQNIPSDFVLCLAIYLKAEFVLMQDTAFLNVSSKQYYSAIMARMRSEAFCA